MKPTPLRHQNVENIEQFDKAFNGVLRQRQMQYLATDLNYQMGFNNAWVFLQGTLGETAVNNVTVKRAESKARQLEAENKTLNEEVERLNKLLVEQEQKLADKEQQLKALQEVQPIDNSNPAEVESDNTLATTDKPVEDAEPVAPAAVVEPIPNVPPARKSRSRAKPTPKE